MDCCSMVRHTGVVQNRKWPCLVPASRVCGWVPATCPGGFRLHTQKCLAAVCALGAVAWLFPPHCCLMRYFGILTVALQSVGHIPCISASAEQPRHKSGLGTGEGTTASRREFCHRQMIATCRMLAFSRRTHTAVEGQVPVPCSLVCVEWDGLHAGTHGEARGPSQ